jgi:23S rRNA (cytidine1920-2'-O)/16S rRNA (cytidine1409-2'-O)-methyltransferase
MNQTNKKFRLDQLLVDRNLAPSRERAQAIIIAGQAIVKDQVVDKPGRMFPETIPLEVRKDPNPFVSRGGLKLLAALDHFKISVENKSAIDIGASSGGFSDCLLQRQIKNIIAVDVGYGQLNWKIQSDPRVKILDRTNARYITLETLECDPLDLAVIDVSFISLRLILPPTSGLLKKDGDIIALVKPQFEVGKNEMENKGIIKDPAKHLKVLLELTDFVKNMGWVVSGAIRSPITGQKGNQEFLIHVVQDKNVTDVTEEFFNNMVYQSGN